MHTCAPLLPAGDWAEIEFDSRKEALGGNTSAAAAAAAAAAGGGSSEADGEDLTLAGDGKEAAEVAADAEKATVYLIYLRSYQGMGMADIACTAGCTCKRAAIDGTWRRQASLQEIKKFAVSCLRGGMAWHGKARVWLWHARAGSVGSICRGRLV